MASDTSISSKTGGNTVESQCLQRPKRHALWLLTIPVILYLLTPLVANNIHPIVLGMPFIVFYTVGVTVLTPVFVLLVAQMDPLYRSGDSEPVPADFAYEDVEASRTAEAGRAANGVAGRSDDAGRTS